MKVLCMYDHLYVSHKEQIQYAKEFGTKMEASSLVIEGWNDPTVESLPQAIYRLEKNGPEGEPIDPAFLENKDAGMLVVSFCPVSSAAMDSFDHLRVIGVSRTGTENVDIEEATKRGIMVVNAGGRNANAVSDYAIGLMLAETRNIARQHALMKNGGLFTTHPNNDFIPDLCGKTIGLFGFGYIGKLVAEKLSGFHVNILAVDPFVSEQEMSKYNVQKVDLETLCRKSDIISIHARQNKENFHTFGKEQFAMMKPTGYFINTVRARIVDDDAMVETLENRVIMGAAVDVYPEMPLAVDAPIRKLDNITLSAHLAGSSRDAIINSWKYVFQRSANIIKGVSNFGVLNPEVLENEEFKKWRDEVRAQVNVIE